MKIKGMDEPAPVNRKLVIWIFLITGIVSGVLWWQGSNGKKVDGSIINPVTETRVMPTLMPTQTKKPDELKKVVEERIATQSGTYAIYVIDLKTDEEWGINEREIMEGASIMKVPAMIAAMQKIKAGEMTLQDKYSLKEVDRSPGSGPLQYATAGTEVTLERLLLEMGQKSDNTGWRMMNRILGREVIESTMSKLKMTNSEYVTYTTTAQDVANMFAYVDGVSELKMYLKDSIYEDRITVGVPKGTEVIHKVGTLEGVWEDAGIVNGHVLVILNKGVKRAEAEKFVPGLTKVIWQKWQAET